MVWCDNCLLVFPLRGGAMALSTIITIYSIAGGVILFLYGNFLYDLDLEYQLYGGIAMAVAAIAVLSVFAYSNNAYMLARLIFIVSPILLFVSAVRGGIMVYRLNEYQDEIVWQCNNGGTLYNATIANLTATDASYIAATDTGTKIPSQFCSAGFHTLYVAFAVALIIDLILQVYSWFMMWRFKARLQDYFAFRTMNGGVYSA